MKAELRLDDDLYDAYKLESHSRRVPLGDILRERLALALPLDPRRRGLIVATPTVLADLEACLGGGHLLSEADLLEKVQRLARIKFGDYAFPITPGQFAELEFRATKTGRTVPQLVEAIYRKVSADFFSYVP
jgi:hypothetical protein